MCTITRSLLVRPTRRGREWAGTISPSAPPDETRIVAELVQAPKTSGSPTRNGTEVRRKSGPAATGRPFGRSLRFHLLRGSGGHRVGAGEPDALPGPEGPDPETPPTNSDHIPDLDLRLDHRRSGLPAALSVLRACGVAGRRQSFVVPDGQLSLVPGVNPGRLAPRKKKPQRGVPARARGNAPGDSVE